jgi:beta-lactam-binding protein with PASTA domain
VTHKHSRIKKGRVVSQKPGRGVKRPRGSKVALVVSSGRR